MAEKQPIPVEKEAASQGEAIRNSLLNLRQEADRVFGQFRSWLPAGTSLLQRPLAHLGLRANAEPPADVIDRQDVYEIDIDVPGITRDNIEVALADHSLTVNCRVLETEDVKPAEYCRRERHHQSFSRAFQLPSGVDAEKIAADLVNGVLKITMPKIPEEQQTRKIDVMPH